MSISDLVRAWFKSGCEHGMVVEKGGLHNVFLCYYCNKEITFKQGITQDYHKLSERFSGQQIYVKNGGEQK